MSHGHDEARRALGRLAGDGDLDAARELVRRLEHDETVRLGVQIDERLREHDLANGPRRCENEECGAELEPGWPAVYCSNACAHADA